MSDYKLTFKLKQHTPIIHFHHYRHGAVLRASEVKSKLGWLQNKSIDYNQNILYYCKSIDYNQQNITE